MNGVGVGVSVGVKVGEGSGLVVGLATEVGDSVIGTSDGVTVPTGWVACGNAPAQAETPSAKMNKVSQVAVKEFGSRNATLHHHCAWVFGSIVRPLETR